MQANKGKYKSDSTTESEEEINNADTDDYYINYFPNTLGNVICQYFVKSIT